MNKGYVIILAGILLFVVLTYVYVPTQTAILYSKTGDTYSVLSELHPSADERYSAFGQSFQIPDEGSDYNLATVSVRLKKYHQPTGLAYVVLYRMVDSVPLGTPLAISDSFDVSTLTTSMEWYDFTFSDRQAYSMKSGEWYCITYLNPVAGTIDISNSVYVGLGDDTEAGRWSYYAKSNWHVAVSSYDVNFIVYGETPVYPYQAIMVKLVSAVLIAAGVIVAYKQRKKTKKG